MGANPLPPAVAAERDKLLDASLRLLQLEGYKRFRVHDHPSHPEPGRLLVPVLNVRVSPDIVAEADERRPGLVAFVEVSSGLGEEACGRRWQALVQCAQSHDMLVAVFVHPEDLQRAKQIARHWAMGTGIFRPVSP